MCIRTWHLHNRRHRCSDGWRILVGDHKNAGAGGGEDKHVVFNVQCLVFDVWLAMFNTAIQKTNMWQLSSVAQEGWGFS